MSPSPFRILPWDFFDTPQTNPLHIESIQISGAARRFELLPRGGRVYFRLAGGDSRLWATLEDSGDPNFVRVFRRAVGNGRIGRVFEQRLASFSRVYLLVAASGKLQVREWCMPDWVDLPFGLESTSGTRHEGIFSPHFPVPSRKIAGKAQDILEAQTFTDAERRWTARRWMRGSEEEWKLLLRSLATLCPDGIEVQAELMPGEQQHAWKEGKVNSTFAISGLGNFPFLLQAVNAHFFVAGLRWVFWSHRFEFVPENEMETILRKRVAWRWNQGYPYPRWSASALTSSHERLEVRLFLRDWLQDKLPPSQIEEVLNHAPK